RGAAGWAVSAAAETYRPFARYGGEHPARYLADAVVKSICDVDVARSVNCDAIGVVQLGAGSRAVIAAEAWHPVSRHSGDHPVRDFADAVIRRVGDIEAACGVHGDAEGLELSGGGGPVVG